MKTCNSSLLLIFSLFVFLSCENTQKYSAEAFVNASIETHGMKAFNKKSIAFRFRNYRYSQTWDSEGLIFTRQKNTTPEIFDRLHSKNGFDRIINNKKAILPDSISKMYSESLNSVLYFFRLPYTLKDVGAIKTLMNTESIMGSSYQKIGVHFTSENGGVDYQDTFRYWFEKETKTLDYLAYQFHTNVGGNRFRVAINRRIIDGIVFQDYENYRAPKNIPLDELPTLYEQGKLELLSLIEKDSIIIMKP